MHTYFMHVGDRSHEREWLWNVTILRLSHDVAGFGQKFLFDT